MFRPFLHEQALDAAIGFDEVGGLVALPPVRFSMVSNLSTDDRPSAPRPSLVPNSDFNLFAAQTVR